MARVVESTFSEGKDRWSLGPDGSGSVKWGREGGNPDGYLVWRTADLNGLTLLAPRQFTGDKHAYVNGSFSFDYLDKGSHDAFAILGFRSSNGKTVSWAVDLSGQGWDTFTIDLTAQTELRHHSASEIRQVFSDVVQTELYLSSSVFVTGGLDNVIFAPHAKPAADAAPAAAFVSAADGEHAGPTHALTAAHGASHLLDPGVVLA